MSIEQFLIDNLSKNGLYDDEARAVVGIMKAKEDSMQGRWEDPIDHYPPQLKVILWMEAKQEAVDWLAKNKPDHFARMILSQ